MAVKYGFFDAAYDEQTGEYDRQYFSDDMSNFFHAIVGNGVFKDISDGLIVTPSGTGMSVVVRPGFATVLGRYINNTEPYTIEIDDADLQDRVDIIVASMSTLQNKRSFELIVKKGEPGVTPVAPSLTRNDGTYEIQLAAINIPNTATVITYSMIEDTRDDEELCGFVSGLGGGAEFINCTINDQVDAYSSAWLLDDDGNAFQPEEKKVYRVIDTGLYENCIYVFDEDNNVYVGVGSYNLELTSEEAVELWNNGSLSRLSNIPAPTSNIQYTGQRVSPVWLYYDPTKVRLGGTTSAINAGNYYASFEPINGYAWPDGTTDLKYIMWTIVKKIVPIPVPVQTRFNYDGSLKTVVFNNLDTNAVSVSNASATNTGTYSVTATLNDPLNNVWSDDTYVQRAWEFRIVGMQNTVVLSDSYVTFNADTDIETITVSSTNSGAVSVESTDETIVHADVSGNTITVIPGSSILKGTASVIVTVEGDSVYDTGVATISVTKNYGIVIVSFADGTDAEIAAMVQAADNGDIDLHDYWHIGDERDITLGAIAASGSSSYGSWSVNEAHSQQTNKLILMDSSCYTLQTPVLDKNKNVRNSCSFVVGLKYAMLETGYIDSRTSYTQPPVWKETDRYSWCNNAFPTAIPNALLPAFKKFVVSATSVNTGGSVGTTNDLFSLFAEGEIFSNSSEINSFNNEYVAMHKIEYFKTAGNRIKTVNGGSSGVNWYTRSKGKNDSGGIAFYWCYVNADGTTTTRVREDGTYYLLPFGCI